MNKPAPLLTICIPCAPYHDKILPRALLSCVKQTVPVFYGVYNDIDGQGAGYARNKMLESVQTPYVTFLDADDWLEDDFAAKMIAAIQEVERAGKYVYCSWIEDYPDGRVDRIEAPVKAWCGSGVERDSHLITSIYMTQWVHMIGGFDATLPGMEDVDFALKMRAASHCGVRLNEFLVHYSDHGKRSDDFKAREDHDIIFNEVRNRYRNMSMACCDDKPTAKPPMGDQMTGDVRAVELKPPILAGYTGRATLRRYTLNGIGSEMWINPEDAMQDADRFRIIPLPPPKPPAPVESRVPRQGVLTTSEEIAQVMMAGAQKPILKNGEVFLPQNELQGKKGRIDLEKIKGLAGKKKS